MIASGSRKFEFLDRKIVGLVALLLGVAVLVIILLASHYRGMVAQQENAENIFLSHTRGQASALHNFLTRAENELTDLAERRVVTAYFANKSLGITMQYGLKISLLDLAAEIDERLVKSVSHGKPLFSRMALIDKENLVVWDSFDPQTPPGKPWHQPIQDIGSGFTDSSVQLVILDQRGPNLMVQAPCWVKENLVGTLVGFIPLDTMQETVKSNFPGITNYTWLTFGNRPLLCKEKTGPAADILNHILALPLRPDHVLRTRVKIDSQQNLSVMATCSMVGDLPLCVVRMAPLDKSIAQVDPRRVLITMALTLLVLMAGIGALAHSKVRQVALGDQLIAETELNKLISAQKHELEVEIKQRQTVEHELREAKEDAEAASFAKGQFLANMSHEIRTPLNGVLGLTELVLETELDELQQEYLNIALDSGNSLLRIINDILDVSRIEAGRIELEAVNFNLRNELDNVIQSFSATTQKKGIGLELIMGNNVPGEILGDSVRIRQILVNLIGNAVKFTTHGSVQLEVVWVLNSPDYGELSFYVRDTGIGIPPSKLDSIFEAFSQADGSTTRLYGGTGLGLTISNNLAQLMGGKLTVTSKTDEGSVFTFTYGMPFLAEEVEKASVPCEVQVLEPTRMLKILVAEDNSINQFYIKKLLENKGHQVCLAGDGEQALIALNSEPFDLVLVDMQMPVMDGLEVAVAWRKIEVNQGRQQMPLIALTAHAMPQDRQRCLNAGMNDYLAKPIDTKLLEATLARWADSSPFCCNPQVSLNNS